MNDQLKPEHEEIVNKYIEDCKNNQISHYMITISRDGEKPARTIIFYGDVIEAVEAYNMYKDWGFAKQYLTVCLYEPSGKINTKVFKRNQAGDPTFLRQNYIDVTDALLDSKPFMPSDIYDDLCIKIMKSFAKDNWRFNPERFLENLKISKSVNELGV
jgi:hypothetical protein